MKWNFPSYKDYKKKTDYIYIQRKKNMKIEEARKSFYLLIKSKYVCTQT